MRLIMTVSALIFVFPGACGAPAAEESFRLGRFGRVILYSESRRPSHVVLFVSGDGGWNKGVVDMARNLSSLDAVVVGIDINHYLKNVESSGERCSYPAADFEVLSKFVQRHLTFSRYAPPVLVGYSSGATLAYAILVQAPPNTFQGAISMGFCPDLPLTRPLCRGNGLEWETHPGGKGYRFLPAVDLQTPWIAFQGAIDRVCNASMVAAFVKQVPRGDLVLLPKVGHGFTVQRNWMPQFRKTFIRLVEKQEVGLSTESNVLKDLPLIEIPAKEPGYDILAVILSGDGGWAGIDRELGNTLAGQGVSVVGLNSLQYFWTSRTPDGAGADLERIIRHYLIAWKKRRVILIGYSLGADVLPFMANRLSGEILARVRLMALLGPGRKAEFEFHLTDWFESAPGKTARPLLPEVEKLRDKKLLCFYGEEEKDSLCRGLDRSIAESVSLRGAHHFGGNYRTIAETILREAQ